MKFIIRRTNTWRDEKPCEEAKKIKIPSWHTRTLSEKEFNEKFSHREGLWRDKGKNHKVTDNGYITRQEDDKEVWSIKIKTLEDLMFLYGKYGDLIITKSYINDEYYELEIYDDYRE